MKGHTVPWAFLPKEIQAILAIALLVVAVIYTYRDQKVVRCWWPWLFAIVSVLLTPVLVGWLGFEPQGIRAKSMAAELQSLASSSDSWWKPVISALQSISSNKGMGLKTAGVIFMAGAAFGRLLVLPAYERLLEMGILVVSPRDQPGNERGEANPQPRQARGQENPLAPPQDRQRAVPLHHVHGE
ncbi:hypothetical protein ACOMHN_040341 [Nucella lapillus]